MSSSKPKLTIKNLSKSFNDSQLKVLDSISLNVHKGECVSIIGPSGCGKSTLLDCVAGLTKFDGEVKKNGGTAYMFQDDVMLPWRTVLDNVMIPLEIAGITKKAARIEAQKQLEIFGFGEIVKKYPFQLSGGMRERVSLLRTYLCKKEIMLLDEPFSKLDALTRQTVQQWFLNNIDISQKSVLFVTHDVEEAIYLSDRIYILTKSPGKIIGEVHTNLKKSRSKEIIVTPEFVRIKKNIIKFLRNS